MSGKFHSHTLLEYNLQEAIWKIISDSARIKSCISFFQAVLPLEMCPVEIAVAYSNRKKYIQYKFSFKKNDLIYTNFCQ